ncbi:MAG: hypothetical protein Q6367_015810, partial [Candidatus Freyarchaeota archaeon]
MLTIGPITRSITAKPADQPKKGTAGKPRIPMGKLELNRLTSPLPPFIVKNAIPPRKINPVP